ncbi:MAG TPA: dienelactone hydrolase family protein [Nitrospiraceae bacterium]|jgi:carboxymethylenebutenolidase|nr:dienelactone hydrolase family protein [Nitrospiraceae bacterium]
MGQNIELKTKDGQTISAYKAEPAGKPRGGIVVIQEIWGVNSHIRDVADRYAKEGYLAIAPAIFDRIEPGVKMDQYTQETMQKGFGYMQKVDQDKALLDVSAAVAEASKAGKVGVVGFCFGGRMAWLAAARVDGIAASVPYYGGGVPQLASEKPKVPVMLHFGEKDAHIPVASVEEFKKVHPTLPVYIYAADHGFNCDQRGSYDADAAKLAQDRTLEFFRKHVG